MDIRKRIFPTQADALRPRLACEILPAGVVAARPGPDHETILSTFAPMRAGVLTPGLKPPNFADRSAVATALRIALGEIAARERQVTVIVPDAAVRVLMLDFDTLPSKPADAMPIVRFRLRKLVPFDVEDAALSYQVMPSRAFQPENVVRVIAAIMPHPVLIEYESAVREAGYEPGVVLSSTLAALASLSSDEPSLIVNRNANSVTTAITRQNELLLHRTIELTQAELYPEENARHVVEELKQTVNVAMAYFEDTLSAPPRHLLAVGPGGAEELIHLLGDNSIPARDLVPATGASPTMPRGILAGVVGALAS